MLDGGCDDSDSDRTKQKGKQEMMRVCETKNERRGITRGQGCVSFSPCFSDRDTVIISPAKAKCRQHRCTSRVSKSSEGKKRTGKKRIGKKRI